MDKGVARTCHVLSVGWFIIISTAEVYKYFISHYGLN